MRRPDVRQFAQLRCPVAPRVAGQFILRRSKTKSLSALCIRTILQRASRSFRKRLNGSLCRFPSQVMRPISRGLSFLNPITPSGLSRQIAAFWTPYSSRRQGLITPPSTERPILFTAHLRNSLASHAPSSVKPRTFLHLSLLWRRTSLGQLSRQMRCS